MTLADNAPLRRSVYALLMTVTAALTTARIVGVENVVEPSIYKAYPSRTWPPKAPEPSPTFSSNDRSRWATIRALVDNGTYVVGERRDDPQFLVAIVSSTAARGLYATERLKDAPYTPLGYRDEGILFESGYRSIDAVKNPETDKYYSSKPPLLPTVLAGEYWLLKRLFGWSLAHDTWPAVCTILITVNVVPLIVFLYLLSRLLEDYGTTDWGRLFVFATACFGTFLTTFAVTLNNHTPAACCALFALYPLLKKRGARSAERGAKEESGEQDLPARSASKGFPPDPWIALRAGEEERSALRAPRSELLLSGFFAGLTVALELPAAAFLGLLGLFLLWREPRRTLLFFAPAALVPLVALVLTNYLAIGEFVPAYSKFGGPWYEYPGSHWAKAKTNPNPGGIDFAREDKLTYAFHVLLGHHGLFSLTPVWLLAAWGAIMGLRNADFGLRMGGRDTPLRSDVEDVEQSALGNPQSAMGFVCALTLVTFVVVTGFYVRGTNNYGGWTSGARWLFWFTPLFLLCLPPVADALGRRRWGRWLAYFLLAVSVFSAAYPVWNPWRHPWIYQLCEYMGWLRY